MMREIFFPAQWLYQGTTGFRNWLYDHSVLRTFQANSKVIAIGNLTLGGTGKTPVTLAIVESLLNKNYSCGVISRGYKRQMRGILEVGISPKAALDFGDEPALIKYKFPDIPVFVGNRRSAAAQALLSHKQVKFIVCDDAFQHRALHRDLNILLLDATESQRNYRLVPVGRARESLTPALNRANFIIITKANFVSSEELEGLTKWVKERTDKPLIFGDYVFKGMKSTRGEIVQTHQDPVYLVSGIAKPASLEKTLGDRVKVVKHKTFPDHHRYTDLEVEALIDEASSLEARWILSTAKDSMKLSSFPRLRERLWVLELGIQLKGEVNVLYEEIDRLARESLQ